MHADYANVEAKSSTIMSGFSCFWLCSMPTSTQVFLYLVRHQGRTKPKEDDGNTKNVLRSHFGSRRMTSKKRKLATVVDKRDSSDGPSGVSQPAGRARVERRNEARSGRRGFQKGQVPCDSRKDKCHSLCCILQNESRS